MASKRSVFAALAVGVVGQSATPSGATHPHHIDTPGACVDRNGSAFGTGQPALRQHREPGRHHVPRAHPQGDPGHLRL